MGHDDFNDPLLLAAMSENRTINKDDVAIVIDEARAVHALAPEMTYAQAYLLADKATNWAAQAHHKWFWRGIPGTVY